MKYQQAYEEKATSPQKAVEMVKDGDLIVYSEHILFPESLDNALAQRAADLKDIAVRTLNSTKIPKFVEVCGDRSNIAWMDRHYNGLARNSHKKGDVNYIPGTYHQQPEAYSRYIHPEFAFIETTPMDKHGYFNYGVSNSELTSLLQNTKNIIVETNPNVPVGFGGGGECIHISQIAKFVEGEGRKLIEVKDGLASNEEIKVAELVIGELSDGCCLQLGIGALPNTIGNLICESDLKDLGVHTEMLSSSYVNMYEAGKITGKNKTIDKGKMTYTFALGTKRLYDFIDSNPICASYPAEYTNNPALISQNDKVVSINNALEVDLFSQVSSESIGPNQISGTGGQFDFHMGAFNSRGGKGIICLTSTYKDKEGKLHSRIRPHFDPCSNVTVPRSFVHYVATEYGIAQLKGLSAWARAEAIINLAHPDFREELIKDAERLKIWSYTNKKM